MAIFEVFADDIGLDVLESILLFFEHLFNDYTYDHHMAVLSIFVLLRPVHHPVVHESTLLEKVQEKASQPGVIRLLLVL